jgi:hypothetical protein
MCFAQELRCLQNDIFAGFRDHGNGAEKADEQSRIVSGPLQAPRYNYG